MANAVFHQAIGILPSHHLQNSGIHQEFGNVSVKSISKGFKFDLGLSMSRNGGYSSSKGNSFAVEASTSQNSVVHPISAPSNNSSNEFQKKSSKQFSLCSAFHIQLLKVHIYIHYQTNSGKAFFIWLLKTEHIFLYVTVS